VEPVTALEDRPVNPPIEIDINDGHLYDDPWETYRWLRDNDPCYWDDKNQIWVVSRHEDVAYISRTTDLYCSKHGVRPNVDQRGVTVLVVVDRSGFDPGRHERLRLVG
jgi:cytochrome P450